MPLSHLNFEQKSAATAPTGYNLIIASAGTGKTSTIVARIAHLLQNGVKPHQILLLTFTNKAASEMVDRVAGFFGESVAKEIEAGTFHAVSYRLLKKLSKNITLKQPNELKVLLKSIYDKRKFHHFDSKTSPYKSSYLYDIYSLFQNSSTKGDFHSWLKESHAEHELYFDIYDDILNEFNEQKNRFGYVGFNDLLTLMRDQLLKGAPISFREILVDEYQDTNSLQGSLIDSFKPKSLFCVGDYDQSIYAFNGANIEIIGSFSHRYNGAKVFTLTKNYRSSSKILSLANRVIEKNKRLYPKALEVTKSGEYEAPKLLIYGELFAQYQAIAKMIKESRTAYEEVAVIFRNNSSADGIEASLKEIGISSKRKGGISFFDAKEIKAILELVAIFVNPKDMISFMHLFEYAKGVGPALSKEIFDGLYKIGDGDILKGFFNPNDEEPFEKRAQNRQLGLFDDNLELGSVGRFYKLGFDEEFLSNPVLKLSKLNSDGAVFLHNMYQFLKRSKNIKRASTFIDAVVNSKIYLEIEEFLLKRRATLKDGSIDKTLLENAKDAMDRRVLLLKNLSKNYTTVDSFLNALTLGSSEMSEGEGVNLLTVHSSKGLEFEDVYIVDLMDGRFPNRKLMSMGGSIEEERRLFYVATTRAKSRLFLSFAKYDRLKRADYIHSLFLAEAGLL